MFINHSRHVHEFTPELFMFCFASFVLFFNGDKFFLFTEKNHVNLFLALITMIIMTKNTLNWMNNKGVVGVKTYKRYFKKQVVHSKDRHFWLGLLYAYFNSSKYLFHFIYFAVLNKKCYLLLFLTYCTSLNDLYPVLNYISKIQSISAGFLQI